MNMIQEAYCSFEVAKLLKEKGFDEPCRAYFINDLGDYRRCAVEITDKDCTIEQILRPTHQMVCTWLIENYNLYVCPKLVCFQGSKKCDKPYHKWEDRVLRLPTNNQVHPQFMGIHEYYSTYEEAVEYAILYALENLI